MEPPKALKRLASSYDLPLECSDRKFYRRYSIKIESHIRANHVTDHIGPVENLRKLARSNKDYLRRERWTVNYYTNSTDTAKDVIDLVQSVNGVVFTIHWFTEHINKNVLIRKKPTQFKYGVRLKSGVNKDRIRGFVDNNRSDVLLDKNTDLDLYPDENSRMSYYANRRTDTWNHTYYRFQDETLKNYFMFSFAESVIQESVYKLFTEVENEQ